MMLKSGFATFFSRLFIPKLLILKGFLGLTEKLVTLKFAGKVIYAIRKSQGFVLSGVV